MFGRTMASKTQTLRKARVSMVLSIIKTMGEIEYMKLIGLVSVEHGIKEVTTRGYLRDLKNAGYITVKDGTITLTEEYKKKIGLKEQKTKDELNEFDKKLQGTKNT